eukprot:4993019-Pyramimonas_sp.AAC.1
MQLARSNPPWKRSGMKSPNYAHAISLPFAGIGGPDRAMMEGGFPAIFVNIIDKRPECKPVLDSLHRQNITMVGLIHEIPNTSLMTSHGLIAGPPCPDFSLQGTGAGLDGAHGSAFLDLLDLIKHLARQAEGLRLRWVVLESVWSITYTHEGGENNLLRIRHWWLSNMPDWTDFSVIRMDARDSGMAQRRDRAFLISFQKDFAQVTGTIDCPPAAMDHGRLEDVLEDVEPNHVERGVTALQEDSIVNYLDKFKNMGRGNIFKTRWFDSKYPDSDLAIVDASRRPTSEPGFGNKVHVGYCPTLTTQNRFLVVLSRADGDRNPKVPDKGWRLMTMKERSALSGVVYESVEGLQTEAQLITSFGNAIPVNMAGDIIQLVMDKWAAWEQFLLRNGRDLEIEPKWTEDPRPQKRQKVNKRPAEAAPIISDSD